MDPIYKCCVLGCNTRPNQGIRFYRFPCLNPQISAIWERRIGQSANQEFDILKEQVCELHFSYRCKTGNECALEDGSLPTKNLPNFTSQNSAGDAHFFMSAKKIEEPSYTISIDELSHHCRFCLHKGLLYQAEASTYRNKSFMLLIDLPENMLLNNSQTNVCLSCLKSIVIAHQLSMAIKHSNTILQLLLKNPKQSKVVSNVNFFDIKAELVFCNLIAANFIKQEVIESDNMVWVNEDCKLECDSVGDPSLEESILCHTIHAGTVTGNHDNVSKMHNAVTSDNQFQNEFYKSIAFRKEYETELGAQEIPDASEDSDSCVLRENAHSNVELIISDTSDDSCAEDGKLDKEQTSQSISKAVNEQTYKYDEDIFSDTSHNSCAEDRKLDNEQAPQTASKAVNEPIYKCDLCKFSTNYETNLALHKNLHSDGNDKVHFHCQKCEKYFLVRRNFVSHNTRVHHDDFICKICDKSHASAKKLAVHYTEHQHFRCEVCSRVLKRTGYRAHMMYHKLGKKLCTFCGKIVFSKHKCPKNRKKDYHCTHCSFSSIYFESLQRHQDVHNPDTMRFLCNHCGRGFRQSSTLIAHNQQHVDLEKPIKCILCPKEFKTKYDHRQHKKTHWYTNSSTTIDKNAHWNENDGVYVCPICDWKNPSYHTFNAHLGKHEVQSDKNSVIESEDLETLDTDFVQKEDGRYQCTKCSKTFLNPQTCSAHKKVHTKERPYKCKLCPSEFTVSHSLKRHVIHRHSDLKPYQCDKCDKSYKSLLYLRIHAQMHNADEFKCNFCDKTYKKVWGLYQHKRRVHKTLKTADSYSF